jgi:hypothetical protein
VNKKNTSLNFLILEEVMSHKYITFKIINLYIYIYYLTWVVLFPHHDVIISAPFGVEITNNSYIALLFVIFTPNGAEITIISMKISFSFNFWTNILHLKLSI